MPSGGGGEGFGGGGGGGGGLGMRSGGGAIFSGGGRGIGGGGGEGGGDGRGGLVGLGGDGDGGAGSGRQNRTNACSGATWNGGDADAHSRRVSPFPLGRLVMQRRTRALALTGNDSSPLDEMVGTERASAAEHGRIRSVPLALLGVGSVAVKHMGGPLLTPAVPMLTVVALI